MNNSFTSKNNIFLGLFVIVTIVCLIALGPYLKIQSLVTTRLIPLLFVISILLDAKTLHKNNTEFLWLLLILIGGLMTVFYYLNYDVFFNSIYTLLGTVMAAYISIGLNKNRDYTTYFHIGYVLSILILIAIMYINGNFSFSNFATKIDYRDRFLLNANAYSYFSFFANISLFYLHQRYKSKLLTISLILLPLLFIIISFVTQSRSGLLIVIFINLIYWLFIAKIDQTNPAINIGRKLIVIIAIVLISIKIIDIYENSRIKSRVDTSLNQGDSREKLIKESLDNFYKHPIIGVGLGQLTLYNEMGQFSHNTYVEILAEQGIIGGFFLFMLFYVPIRKSVRLFRLHPSNPIIKLNLLFFISFYLFNNIYPFYKFPFSMMYFFLIISVQNNIASKVNHENEKNVLNPIS